MQQDAKPGELKTLRRRALQSRPVRRQRVINIKNTLGLIARAFILYSIYTLCYRCPSSLDNASPSTPWICSPYSKIGAATYPHFKPIYDRYAAPAVEIAKPYVKSLTERVISPTREFIAIRTSPLIVRAKQQAASQWEDFVQPRVSGLIEKTKDKYNHYIAPNLIHISRPLWKYCGILQESALATYDEVIIPIYEFLEPRVRYAVAISSTYYSKRITPTLAYYWIRTKAIIQNGFWPHIRRFYRQNVAPQLARIGERLGRHNLSNLANVPAVEASLSSGSQHGMPSTASTPLHLMASVTPPMSSELHRHASGPASISSSGYEGIAVSEVYTVGRQMFSENFDPLLLPKDSPLDKRPIHEVLAEDLTQWENKFMSTMNERARDIESRVSAIVQHPSVKVAQDLGRQLVSQLQDVVDSELHQLEEQIPIIINSLAKEPIRAEEQIAVTIRGVGLRLKEETHLVRKWRTNFDIELESSASKAADGILHVLDEVLHLGSQRIGMKWAWMEGLTYQDWNGYSELRNRLHGLTEDLRRLPFSHPGVQSAQLTAGEIEDTAIQIAQAAAASLLHLKQASSEKFTALKDSTLDNSTVDNSERHSKDMTADPPFLANINKSQILSARQADSPTGTEAGSTASLTDVGDPDGHDANMHNIPQSGAIRPEASNLPMYNGRDRDSTYTDTLNVSPHILPGFRPGTLLDVHPADKLVGLPDASRLYAARTSCQSIQCSQDGSVCTPASTRTSKSAFLGAIAQSISSRGPILDDDAETAGTVAPQASGADGGLLSSASEAYSAVFETASSHLSHAYQGVSQGVDNTQSSLTKIAAEWARVESIAQGKLEAESAWARSQYESAKIALNLAKPTPTAGTDRLLNQAKYHYYAGLGAAQARYSDFIQTASSAFQAMTELTPSPTNAYESVSSFANEAAKPVSSAMSFVREGAMSGAKPVSSAVSALSEGAIAAAVAAGESASIMISIAKDGASSAAVVARERVSSAASVASEAAMIALSVASDSVSSAGVATGEQVKAMGGAVQIVWESKVSEISVQIYGESTTILWYERYYQSATGAVSAASTSASIIGSQQLDAIQSLVSEIVYGKEPSFSESVLSRLNEVLATVTVSGPAFITDVAATLASGADAVKSNVMHMRDEL